MRKFLFALALAGCASPAPPDPLFDAEEVAAYRTRVEGEICRLSRDCDLALDLPADEAACRLVVGAGSWPSGDAHRLDVAEADMCVRTLELFSCAAAQRDRAAALDGLMLGRCFRAVVGAAGEGDACYAPGDCGANLYCTDLRNPDLPEGPCPGSCQRRSCLSSGEGAECDPATERCSADGTSCVAMGAEGDPCEGETCGPSLYCQSGVCTAPGVDGNDCSVVRCAQGLRCLNEDFCIRPRFELGEDESCAAGDFCARGLFCNGSTCARQATLGEECADLVAGSPSLPCAADLYCRAEAGEPGRCEPRGMPGDACESLGARSGSHQPPCYGECLEGVCVASDDVPPLCERE